LRKLKAKAAQSKGFATESHGPQRKTSKHSIHDTHSITLKTLTFISVWELVNLALSKFLTKPNGNI
jgi:hypothetical protein